LEHHWGERPYLIRGYLNWLGLWTTRFVGVSQTVGAMLQRNGVDAARVAVVSNGLNLAEIRAASESALPSEIVARLNGHAPILVTLGRISAMKGHDLLIEAVARVKQTFPDVLCLLGGAVLSSAGVEDTDAFVSQIQERIRVLQLEDNIAFLGEVDYAPALLKRADVYVQPSRTESFCRAVVEALDCGTPVAAFAAGALPEVVGGGGILVAPEDVAGLAAAIVRLAQDSALRAECVRVGQEHIRAFDVVDSAAALREVLVECGSAIVR
jgi:glycosyltransferase involved in cell wall biosynthesis